MSVLMNLCVDTCPAWMEGEIFTEIVHGCHSKLEEVLSKIRQIIHRRPVSCSSSVERYITMIFAKNIALTFEGREFSGRRRIVFNDETERNLANISLDYWERIDRDGDPTFADEAPKSRFGRAK